MESDNYLLIFYKGNQFYQRIQANFSYFCDSLGNVNIYSNVGNCATCLWTSYYLENEVCAKNMTTNIVANFTINSTANGTSNGTVNGTSNTTLNNSNSTNITTSTNNSVINNTSTINSTNLTSSNSNSSNILGPAIP